MGNEGGPTNVEQTVNVGLMNQRKIRVSKSGQVPWRERSNGHEPRSEGQPGRGNDISKGPVAKRKKKKKGRM